KWTMVNRFQIETSTTSQRCPFIAENRASRLLLVTPDSHTQVTYQDFDKKEERFVIEEFIDVKGWKALGNKLVEGKIKILNTEVVVVDEPGETSEESDELYNTGDTVELDAKKGAQGELF